jgi:lipocalin
VAPKVYVDRFRLLGDPVAPVQAGRQHGNLRNEFLNSKFNSFNYALCWITDEKKVAWAAQIEGKQNFGWLLVLHFVDI